MLPDLITLFWPLLVSLVLVTFFLSLLNWLLLKRHSHLNGEQKLPRQLTMLVANIVGIITIVLTLPVSEAIQNQILALIGILLSGMVAFSSTSIMTNVMAGLVLRFNKPFRVGDFVRVNGFSGRVAEMGLLDTEIQTETRELISFANSVLVNSPLTVVRSSGAIISVELSLGYEVHHSKVEKHLLSAASHCGLEDSFVQVIGLGDYAVSYRVAGLLTDVKSMLSARSKLHKAVLDSLHQAGIEIVSPAFTNTRPQEPGIVMIPAAPRTTKSANHEDSRPEAVIFDKAEEAEAIQQDRVALEEQLATLQTAIKDAEAEEKNLLKEQLNFTKTKLDALNNTQPKPEGSSAPVEQPAPSRLSD